jgi:glycine/D-amino acid oxidase-like deaminating enzyme
MSVPVADVLVVGAGIIGSACANELAGRGHSVTVFEAADVAAETSCRAMGWVGVYDESPAEVRLCQLSLALWEQLAPEMPADVEYTRRGAIWVAESAADLDRAEQRAARMKAAGVETRLVDGAGLLALEPHLKPGLAGGLFVPNDVVLDAAAATRFLADRALKHGATFRVRTRVTELLPDGVRLHGGEVVHGERLVVAAGWRTPDLVPGLPVRPRKGTIARTVPRPGLVTHQLAEITYMEEIRAGADDSLTLGVQPRANGQYLLGTSRQNAGDSLTVDPEVVRRIRERAGHFVPGLGDVPVEATWSGLRPAGPDEVPLIGRWPAQPSWILATAHEGIGITTSVGTARLVAELVDGARPSVPPEPYAPSRLRPDRTPTA